MSRRINGRVWVSVGVVGVVIAGMTALAGPINPPAGPVASTGRTLDEIYNKIPVVGGADGRIAIGTAPFAIATPGSYVLTANLSSSAATLLINADNVTLDLNGFTVTNTSTAANTLSIVGTRSNVTVRNGTVAGGANGINISGTVMGVLLEDLTVVDAKTAGINFAGGSNRGCRVLRCQVIDTGSTTVAADGSLAITGIAFAGGSGRVEDCSVSRLLYNGGGVATFRGISLSSGGTGNVVARCTVSHDAAITGSGIVISGSGIYRDNNVLQFSTPYSVAGVTNGGGNN